MSNPTPDPRALCRACPTPYGNHTEHTADHPFRPLLTGQRPPGWMSREERHEFEAFLVAGSPVKYRPGPRGGPRTFELAEREGRATPTTTPDPVRAMQDRLAEAYAVNVDRQVTAHLEAAAVAHDALVAEQAGPTWQHRALNLAARLRSLKAELAEVRRQRDQAERTAAQRGEHLDQLEGMIRRFAIDTGAVDAEADEPCDAEAVPDLCGDTIGPVPKLDGQVLTCTLYAGHDGDHRDGSAWWVERDAAGARADAMTADAVIRCGDTHAWGYGEPVSECHLEDGHDGWHRDTVNGGCWPPAREAVQCDATIENVDVDGKGIGYPCELRDGHDQPHRAGGWTWR